ncbi:uncharacterized protein MONOS_18114 [Monocercomonoides exilis]|uniref:uncharacterized protein n=1 Tax=Monocercomonoides exilis TaxID=2049356 RepID=UPI00355A0933|nr:hypothetical protein MONOS_18114 [Monocercomonoides exilis]
MVFEEEKKKEGKNVELLIDLCKCCLLLCECLPNELYHICVPNLLKLALEKEENKERQKEVELALLALSTIDEFIIIQKKLYIFEITEIIHHYQQQHSLTHLAYLSAWRFLMNRMQNEKSVECMMTNELHFFREATSELEELSRYVAWEKKEMGAEDITHIIIKWCEMLCELNGKVLEIFDEESEEESMEDNEENEEDNGKEIEKEKTEAEMKITKREIFSKFEEKGYEDVMMSFQQILGS